MAASRRNAVDVTAAKAILADALAGKLPRTERSTKAALLLELKPQIEQLRAQNYSFAQIADLLKATGVGNKDTIRYAIMGGKPAKKKTRPAATKRTRKPNDSELIESTNPASDNNARPANVELARIEPLNKEQKTSSPPRHAAASRSSRDL